MEWILKAGMTTLGVLLVLGAADRCGPRIAGMTAALPLVTAPTLAWLAHEQGVDFAVGASIGSVAACAMLALFALAYALAARRWCSAVALLAGGAAIAVMTVPTVAASTSLAHALALALVACALVRSAMPRSAAVVAARPRWPQGRLWVALTVGAFTALLASMGPGLGGFATGLLSSLPLIGAVVAVLEQARGGPVAAAQFLRGYVAGLFGRAAFGTLFALAAPHIGVMAALLLGCLLVALMTLPMGRARQWALRVTPAWGGTGGASK